jgi:hypothetical protein
MTLLVHGSDGKDYEFPYTDTTTVADIIGEIRKFLSEEVYQVDLVRVTEKLPPGATIASLGLAATDKLKFFTRRRGSGAITGRTQSYSGVLSRPAALAPAPPRAAPLPARAYAIPTRTDVDLSAVHDPPDIEAKVTNLLELGLAEITRDDILIALRTTFFDENKASEYLMAKAGQAPPPIRVSERDAGPDLRLTPADRAALQALVQQFPAVHRAEIIQLYYANQRSVEATQATLATWRQ